MDLPRVTVPTLIVSHRKDGCDITPAADAPKLKARLTAAKQVEIVLLDGGAPPQSDPCEAKSQHGFLGIEDEAVAAIARLREGASSDVTSTHRRASSQAECDLDIRSQLTASAQANVPTPCNLYLRAVLDLRRFTHRELAGGMRMSSHPRTSLLLQQRATRYAY